MLNQSANFTTGDGRVLNIREIADIYRNGMNLATPNSGKIQKLDDDNYSIICRFSTTDCDNLESIKTSKAYSLKTIINEATGHRSIESVRCITEHQAADQLVVTSKNGRYSARLKSPSQGGSSTDASEKKQLLEIWDRSRLLKTVDISEIDAHGPINVDPKFGSMSWYPFGDQTKLVYVCQKKRPKFQSFFKQTAAPSPIPKTPGDETSADISPKGKQLNLGDDYTQTEDWGECLDGIHHTIVAVLDIANDFKITTVDVEGHSLAETKWLNGMKTVSVSYPEDPRRIGLIYCNNRKSGLIIHDWSQSKPSEVFTMKSNTHCYHTPRVDHSGQRFIYMMNPFWGPHIHSVRLHIHDLNTNQDNELIDKTTGEADIFARDDIGRLLDDCFSMDGKYIIMVKQDYLYDNICLYSLLESRLIKIKFPTTGLRLLDFKHDVILATGSEVNATPTLFVAVLNSAIPGEPVAWHQMEDCIHLEEVEYEPYKIPTPDGGFASALLVSPNVDAIQKSFVGESKDSSKLISHQADLPTIVLVHGGPNSNFVLNYMPTLVFYARLGLRTLLINYRGSTGVSEDYVKSLCGKVGQLDVDDCMYVIRYFANTKKLIDPKKLIIQGGSHGGFLACHLSCQEEFKFTSAIIRNPVVDISTMHTTTDIPDWCYSQALGHESFDYTRLPSSEELVKMYECSPMSKFKQANVPTLMMLGTKDRRVKMFQGERWIELLKARGLKTQCKVYADKHDLSKPEVSADATMTSMIWMLSNL